MLHRFATYEEAALFVTLKRDEGYMADILHDHTAMLWGPLTLGGVAAWVSEEAAGEEDEVPDLPQERLFRLPTGLSLALGRIVLTVVSVWLVLAMGGLLQYAQMDPTLAMRLMVVLLGLALMLSLLLWFSGWFLSAWVHAVWDEQHPRHALASTVHVLLATVLLVIYLIG